MKAEQILGYSIIALAIAAVIIELINPEPTRIHTLIIWITVLIISRAEIMIKASTIAMLKRMLRF